eukprot:995712-Rhodomonas_salina.1
MFIERFMCIDVTALFSFALVRRHGDQGGRGVVRQGKRPTLLLVVLQVVPKTSGSTKNLWYYRAAPRRTKASTGGTLQYKLHPVEKKEVQVKTIFPVDIRYLPAQFRTAHALAQYRIALAQYRTCPSPVLDIL